MSLVLRAVLLSCIVLVCAASAQASAEPKYAGASRSALLREAVAAHRAAERDQVQTDETMAGRRLTPAERAELREQVRSQWLARSDVPPPSTEQPASGGTNPASGQTTGSGWRAFWPWNRSGP